MYFRTQVWKRNILTALEPFTTINSFGKWRFLIKMKWRCTQFSLYLHPHIKFSGKQRHFSGISFQTCNRDKRKKRALHAEGLKEILIWDAVDPGWGERIGNRLVVSIHPPSPDSTAYNILFAPNCQLQTNISLTCFTVENSANFYCLTK